MISENVQLNQEDIYMCVNNVLVWEVYYCIKCVSFARIQTLKNELLSYIV